MPTKTAIINSGGCSLDVRLSHSKAAEARSAALMKQEQEAMQRYKHVMHRQLEQQSGVSKLQAELAKVLLSSH